MTWLRGSSDTANLTSDLYNVLTGTAATSNRGSGQGGNGVTASVADGWDRWDDTRFWMRSRSTIKSLYGPNQAMWRGMPRFAWHTTQPSAGYDTQSGRPTFSGVYNNAAVRAYFLAYVTTPNTAGGSLTGLVVTWYLVNGDTGAQIATGTATAWSGATDTKLLSAGVSLTLTAPAGQFATGTSSIIWYRGYTSTATQGIDYHPEIPRRKAASLVLGTVSGGANAYTENVDYTVVGLNLPFPEWNNAANPTRQLPAVNWDGQPFGGALFSGVSWIAASGNIPAVGATYWLIDADYHEMYVRISYFGGTLMVLATDYADPTTGNGRVMPGRAWATLPVQNSNSGSLYTSLVFTSNPGGTPFINYWISLKATKINVILRGDPAFTGQYALATVQRYQTEYPDVDKLPWVVYGGTSVMNCRFLAPHTAQGLPKGLMGHGPSAYTLVSGSSPGTGTWYSNGTISIMTPDRIGDQTVSAWSNKWESYRIALLDLSGGFASGSTTQYNPVAAHGGRNGLLNGIFLPPLNGYVTADEANDSGVLYFMLGFAALQNNNSSNTGRVAVLEE